MSAINSFLLYNVRELNRYIQSFSAVVRLPPSDISPNKSVTILQLSESISICYSKDRKKSNLGTIYLRIFISFSQRTIRIYDYIYI